MIAEAFFWSRRFKKSFYQLYTRCEFDDSIIWCEHLTRRSIELHEHEVKKKFSTIIDKKEKL